MKWRGKTKKRRVDDKKKDRKQRKRKMKREREKGRHGNKVEVRER